MTYQIVLCFICSSRQQDTMTNLVLQLAACCYLLVATGAQTFDSYFPKAKQCGLQYGKVFKKSPWVCEESQFQLYPEPQISPFLEYKQIGDYLNLTSSCYDYHDVAFKGENAYYNYESLCAVKRKPINVIWAHVPGFKVPAELMGLNGGMLPVHVIRPQRLFDVECIHPWAAAQELEAKTQAPHTPRRRSGLSGINFSGAKRHFCYLGYLYKKNYVCQPTGFVQQDVLVYSPHANNIFIVRVKDIPTSCACTYCDCTASVAYNNPWGF